MGLLSQTQNQYYDPSNSGNYGNYQFTTLENIINAFMFIYVGENKILSKVNRTDVQFHAMRAVQELSYDILKSFKSQELEVPNSLSMILPQDYVNYTKVVRVGQDGIEYPLYPARKTSAPFAITQNTDGTYDFGQQKRVITMTVQGLDVAVTYLNSTYLTLGYNTSANTQGFVSFQIDQDLADLNTYNNPSGEGPVFGIDPGGAITAIELATLLNNAITDFGHHTVTQSGAVLTITYNEDMINTTTVNSTEAFYDSSGSAVGGGGLLIDGMAPVVVNAGTAAGDNIVEQVPSNTSANFQSESPTNYQMYDINYSSDVEITEEGRRYGLDPEHSQANGSFYIDKLRGLMRFGSDLAGKTITLHYVSDGLGTDEEMVVHKFCEEACYKHIAYGILSTRSNIPEYLVQRFKKERFAETRKAKIRLSNIKIEEFAQVLKGMSKQIK